MFKSVKIETVLLIGGGVMLLWLFTRGAKQTGSDIGGGAANLVIGIGEGAFNGLADAVGIPRSNREKCILAQNNKNHFDASLYCTASEFIQWELLNKKLGISSGVSGSW